VMSGWLAKSSTWVLNSFAVNVMRSTCGAADAKPGSLRTVTAVDQTIPGDGRSVTSPVKCSKVHMHFRAVITHFIFFTNPLSWGKHHDMNDEKEKSESFTNLNFGSSVWKRLPGKGNHTDDDRRNELLRHEYLFPWLCSSSFFTSFSILLTVRQMDS
jgi:hypothetical protein